MAERVLYEVDGDRFHPTQYTAGPWSDELQHAGPPSALLARAVEQCEPRPEMVVARTTVEVLGPVPVAAGPVASAAASPGEPEPVRAVLRVPRALGAQLSRALVELQGVRAARKLPPVRVQVDPVGLG